MGQQHVPATETLLQSVPPGRPSAVLWLRPVSVYIRYTINEITEERSEYEESEVNSNAVVCRCDVTVYTQH